MEVRKCLLSFGVYFLSYSLLSKNMKIKLYGTVIFCLLFCMGVKIGLLH